MKNSQKGKENPWNIPVFDFICSKAVDRKRASLLKMKSYWGISESPFLHIESDIYSERL